LVFVAFFLFSSFFFLLFSFWFLSLSFQFFFLRAGNRNALRRATKLDGEHKGWWYGATVAAFKGEVSTWNNKRVFADPTTNLHCYLPWLPWLPCPFVVTPASTTSPLNSQPSSMGELFSLPLSIPRKAIKRKRSIRKTNHLKQGKSTRFTKER